MQYFFIFKLFDDRKAYREINTILLQKEKEWPFTLT